LLTDADSGVTKEVATLQATDYQYSIVNAISEYAQFQLLDISRDGQWAAIKIRTFSGRRSEGVRDVRVDKIVAVNLHTGESMDVGELRDDDETVLGVDWRFNP